MLAYFYTFGSLLCPKKPVSLRENYSLNLNMCCSGLYIDFSMCVVPQAYT